MEFNLSKAPMTKEVEMDPTKTYDTLIIGTGPAGLNAALYLRRKGLEVGMIGRQAGGQVADTSSVENYLGFTGISGLSLVEEFERHVAELEVPILKYYGVTEVKKTAEGQFEVLAEDEQTYRANSLILATGASKRKLGVPGEKELYGRGVTYCAICDGPLYRGKKVMVAGGGNSAVEAAIDLSKICSEVTLVHRSRFRADQILLDQMVRIPNIKAHLETQIQSINGDMGVESVTVTDKATGAVSEIPVEGIFVEIGNIPNTDLFRGLVELTPGGEIIVDANGATSLAGVYAAGDVTTVKYKQIIIAAAQGASAALALNDWYMTRS
ncbi:FAD-dependent oxidoreductase [Proteiniclasticum sp. QWL-01]|uniref:NAD(P)/FAD-dependent oxidoreductase n=1 Tax=Proteiniclasticum sp. QWL-01 TaxID=3036945 RepID=UPI00240EC1F7|nr:FAD-dependent oxidoreductase [Proteiniclasticum sp. QWL-01]WFF72435.1 FAD-dependent oxidoreductase [Proteiniclasticum sp. QWL-01]